MMEIMKQEHSLFVESKGRVKGVVFIIRDNGRLSCPKQQGSCPCGSWCPAFQLYPVMENQPGQGTVFTGEYMVTLGCFPQKVSYKISEVTNEM